MVNSIVDFSSFCTSIVARNATNVVHVRNLDFDAPVLMQKLIYVQNFTDSRKNSTHGQLPETLAPSIAGYFGVYTGYKPGYFSVSYNVRFGAQQSLSLEEQIQITDESSDSLDHPALLPQSRLDEIWTNLRNEINPEYVAT